MRMRRKKNLEERLLECGSLLYQPREEQRDFRADEEKWLDLDAWFEREAPVELEVGCGKGGFICELAARHPDVNFVAVERSANVMVEACERAIAAGLQNVRFIKCTAEYLPRYLKPRSIRALYLNFSCPFPKKKYAVHRLTHPRFLAIYRELLAEGASLYQKTDNRQLFECSLKWLCENGYSLDDVCLDLHRSDYPDNIMTEYERKFVALGQPIYYLQATPPRG